MGLIGPIEVKGQLNRCHHSLHLCHGKHTAEEAVAGVVAACLVAKHCLAVVYAEGEKTL